MKPITIRPAGWHLFVPKLATALREGYGLADARADLFAGLTVSVVALPLSLALAIASGVSPGRGLFTAVVAGAIVSALGGSRHQIAGPTGAFVVVVAGIVQRCGYDGLVVAMLMAGLLLIATGAARLGSYIKYIPFPVITGFTSGIAVVIFSSQIADILGLHLEHVPSDAVSKIAADLSALGTFNPTARATAAATLAHSGGAPKALILRMADVPQIDATGAAALKRFIHSAAAKGTAIIFSELDPAPAETLARMDIAVPSAPSFADSIALARDLVQN